ncbi:hypothetical protein MC885_008105 [Smutsia gigantea]|nr:hypothetical protein MC885_008105 [Smutsia gigantea]
MKWRPKDHPPSLRLHPALRALYKSPRFVFWGHHGARRSGSGHKSKRWRKRWSLNPVHLATADLGVGEHWGLNRHFRNLAPPPII